MALFSSLVYSAFNLNEWLKNTSTTQHILPESQKKFFEEVLDSDNIFPLNSILRASKITCLCFCALKLIECINWIYFGKKSPLIFREIHDNLSYSITAGASFFMTDIGEPWRPWQQLKQTAWAEQYLQSFHHRKIIFTPKQPFIAIWNFYSRTITWVKLLND